MKDKIRKFLPRCALLLAGLLFSGIGVAVTRRGELGVSPVSSVANIVALRFPVLTFGTWLFLWNCVLIAGQALILRREFRLYQLLQIPLSVLFGWFTDLGGWLAAFLPNAWYPARLFYVFLGTAILGFGIALTVRADLIMNAGEAFVKAIADKTGKAFSSVKTVFDVTSVTVSVLLSLVFFPVEIRGAREGTVIAALCTGWMVRIFQRLLKNEKSRTENNRKSSAGAA